MIAFACGVIVGAFAILLAGLCAMAGRSAVANVGGGRNGL